jgi:hypothetical protein
MASSILDKIKEEARTRSPGILKEEDTQKFNNLVGKIVINLSNKKRSWKKGYHSAPAQGDQISLRSD